MNEIKNIKTYLIHFLKGVSIGIVNVLPVSGGTMVLITGIFERFINAIKSFNIKAFRLLFRGGFKQFVRYTDLRFFTTVLLGILFGMLFTSLFLKMIIVKYEYYTWSFFIGLIIASVIYVRSTIRKRNLKNFGLFLLGAIISFLLSLGNNAEPNTDFLYLMLCGLIGSLGMIIPGISGSHLLIIMGNYELIVTQAMPSLMKSATFMDGFAILGPFMLGAIVSLISISYLLSWLMSKYKDATLSILCGFMLGSIPVLYPWKQYSPEMMIMDFELPPMDYQTLISIFVMLIGASVIYIIQKISKSTD